MASLLQTSALLLGEKNVNDPRVKRFADKMLGYCDENGRKAERMIKVLEVLNEEIMPQREEMGEEDFGKIMEALRTKILEIGGVTGFLQSPEGGKAGRNS